MRHLSWNSFELEIQNRHAICADIGYLSDPDRILIRPSSDPDRTLIRPSSHHARAHEPIEARKVSIEVRVASVEQRLLFPSTNPATRSFAVLGVQRRSEEHTSE